MNEDDVHRLRQQLKALQQRLRRETGGGPVSRTGRQVLFAIDRADPSITPGELTTALQMTSSNVAASLRELETAGLIARSRDAGDGRRALLRTTPAGHELVVEHQQGKDAWLSRAIGTTLDDDEQDLLRRAGELIQRLADA